MKALDVNRLETLPLSHLGLGLNHLRDHVIQTISSPFMKTERDFNVEMVAVISINSRQVQSRIQTILLQKRVLTGTITYHSINVLY
jgi:hypothetical protein